MTNEKGSILKMLGDTQKVSISRSPYQTIERSIHVEGWVGISR